MGSACTSYEGTSTYYLRNLTAETEAAAIEAAQQPLQTTVTVLKSAEVAQPAHTTVTVHKGAGATHSETVVTTSFCSTGTLLIGPTGMMMPGMPENMQAMDRAKRWIAEKRGCKRDAAVHEFVRVVTQIVVSASVPTGSATAAAAEGDQVVEEEDKDGLKTMVAPANVIEKRNLGRADAVDLAPPVLLA